MNSKPAVKRKFRPGKLPSLRALHGGTTVVTLRSMHFEFSGTAMDADGHAARRVTVRQALELMSNGSCGD